MIFVFYYFVCRVMSWTNEHDLILCKETIFVNPFSAKKKSVQRSGLWQQIADNLNATDKPRFLVDKRAVRGKSDEASHQQNQIKQFVSAAPLLATASAYVCKAAAFKIVLFHSVRR